MHTTWPCPQHIQTIYIITEWVKIIPWCQPRQKPTWLTLAYHVLSFTTPQGNIRLITSIFTPFQLHISVPTPVGNIVLISHYVHQVILNWFCLFAAEQWCSRAFSLKISACFGQKQCWERRAKTVRPTNRAVGKLSR